MLITLGRNKRDGNAAMIMVEEKGEIFIIGYKDFNGTFQPTKETELFRINITDDRIAEWKIYYNELTKQ